MTDENTKRLGTREIVPSNQRVTRITGLLWGSAGTGKTTLACTAPGKKLLVNFDPDGPASVAGFPNTDVVDFSDAPNSIVDQFKSSDPLGLGKVMAEYDSLIFDSLTNISHKAVMHGISQTKGATIERPSPGAYGVRNALVLQLVKNVLAATAKIGKHVIFIAHEDAPVTNDEGVVMHITLSLGGKLPEQAALDFSEVWCVQDMGTGRDRRILFRPARNRKPMKTRMLETIGEPEFEWNFDPEEYMDDPDNYKGVTLANLYEQWKANEFRKIAPPKRKK